MTIQLSIEVNDNNEVTFVACENCDIKNLFDIVTDLCKFLQRDIDGESLSRYELDMI